MRQLLPTALADVDVEAAFWVTDPGRQHVSAMMISSVDGAAQADGRSGGLGNAMDSQLFALHRAHADVILVGAGTARIEGYGGDHPAAEMRAVRERRGLAPAPVMAVVSGSANLDPDGPLFTDTEVRPIVITCAAAPADKLAALAGRADIIVAGTSRVDIAAALDALAERNWSRVSCEGGPQLLGQLVAAGRLDRLMLTLSPTLLAGDARRITDGPSLPSSTLLLERLLEDEGFLYLTYRVSS